MGSVTRDVRAGRGSHPLALPDDGPTRVRPCAYVDARCRPCHLEAATELTHVVASLARRYRPGDRRNLGSLGVVRIEAAI